MEKIIEFELTYSFFFKKKKTKIYLNLKSKKIIFLNYYYNYEINKKNTFFKSYKIK
jgi:hypothetical protein